jgi:hypothetical protein
MFSIIMLLIGLLFSQSTVSADNLQDSAVQVSPDDDEEENQGQQDGESIDVSSDSLDSTEAGEHLQQLAITIAKDTGMMPGVQS